ncbi:MAG: NlpC/P60 family protein [Paracoccaceae bacterium]
MTPANGQVAHRSLKGKVAAERFVDGEAGAIATALADLLSAPDGARDRQLLRGDPLLVLQRQGSHAFVQSGKDGYCGYVALTSLGPPIRPSHWVSAPATHLYSKANLKSPERASLSLGARLEIVGETGAFAECHDGLFVPLCHLRAVGEGFDDPASVAEMFLGTPYLWGGNSRAGLDCSGLVQAAFLACGIPCPADSDQQWHALGRLLPPGAVPRRGDLFFWKGHVAMACDGERLIHANAHRMATSYEPISEAMARIAAAEGSESYLGHRRL